MKQLVKMVAADQTFARDGSTPRILWHAQVPSQGQFSFDFLNQPAQNPKSLNTKTPNPRTLKPGGVKSKSQRAASVFIHPLATNPELYLRVTVEIVEHVLFFLGCGYLAPFTPLYWVLVPSPWHLYCHSAGVQILCPKYAQTYSPATRICEIFAEFRRQPRLSPTCSGNPDAFFLVFLLCLKILKWGRSRVESSGD